MMCFKSTLKFQNGYFSFIFSSFLNSSKHFEMKSNDYDEFVLYEQLNENNTQTKRKRFSQAEDEKLKQLVDSFGLNWNKISKKFPDKTKRQLKDRWMYYLNPSLLSAPFTPDEDYLLEKKLQEIGPKWRKITQFFPGRTDVALKNRWKMIERHRRNINAKYQKRKKFSPHSSSPLSILAKEDNEQFESENLFGNTILEYIEFESFVEDVFIS